MNVLLYVRPSWYLQPTCDSSGSCWSFGPIKDFPDFGLEIPVTGINSHVPWYSNHRTFILLLSHCLHMRTICLNVFIDDVIAHFIESQLVQKFFGRHVLGFEKFASALVEEKNTVESFSVPVKEEFVAKWVKMSPVPFFISQKSVRVPPGR